MTPVLNLAKPIVGADEDQWGFFWNSNADILDMIVGAVINVLGLGADPTGVTDSAPAFQAALARRRNGVPLNVYAPAGKYLLKSPITVGDVNYSQRLYGDGWSTVLMVGPDFPSSANGVIVIQPGNDYPAQASVTDLRIHFQQPPDFSTTATVLTAQGGMTITVASVTGARVGSYVVNQTSGGSLPSQSSMAKVTDIAGNVVTIDRPTLMPIGVGHVIAFAASRSQMVTLTPTPTLNPGDPGIKYPWGIYCVAQSFFTDHVLVSGAWNGVYIRGQTFAIGQLFVGSLNIALDVDQCYNFPKLDHFMLWGWGLPTAMLGVYYDGQTIAANIGRCDDFTCDVFQTWCGALNLTSTWSGGQINQLKLDGDNSRVTMAGTTGTWTQIGKMYKSGGQANLGIPVALNGDDKVSIGSLYISAAHNDLAITLAGGSLTINGGYMWNGLGNVYPMISVTGGDLSIDQVRFDGSTGRTSDYLTQTGGSVRVTNSAFIMPPAPGAVAFRLIDDARNNISDIALNGWAFTAPGTAGHYDASGQTVIKSVPSATTAQLYLVGGDGANAAEGKLRFGGTFPTGTDTAARHVASLRSGFNSTSWTGGYFDIWLDNVANDAASDANQTRVARFTSSLITFDKMINGINFGPATVGGVTDVSRHLTLYDGGAGNSVGLNVTSGRFNLVAPSGNSVDVVINAVDRLSISATEATFSVPLVTGGAGSYIASDLLNFIQAGGGPNNAIRLTPSAPGGSPNLAVLGGDANPVMTFSAPGTGGFNFQGYVLCDKGVSFGGQLAASINDLSKGIDFYGGIVGLNLTASRLNLVVPSGNSLRFVINSSDRMAITETGMGFNGTAPVAKPTVTGAKGGNTALGSLLTALAAYGLVTDSST
jgi:hypothetical protein